MLDGLPAVWYMAIAQCETLYELRVHNKITVHNKILRCSLSLSLSVHLIDGLLRARVYTLTNKR